MSAVLDVLAFVAAIVFILLGLWMIAALTLVIHYIILFRRDYEKYNNITDSSDDD